MTEHAPAGSWTFLTNHGAVLLAVAAAPNSRVADLATRVGISSRRALSILRDLERAEYLQRVRTGRRNHYSLDLSLPMRHPTLRQHQVLDLVAVLSGQRSGEASS